MYDNENIRTNLLFKNISINIVLYSNIYKLMKMLIKQYISIYTTYHEQCKYVIFINVIQYDNNH